MERRDFLKSALFAGSAFACSPASAFSMDSPGLDADARVKHVLAMFKCHFDAGFIDTQKAVVRRYFDDFFPRAIQVAAQMQHSPHPYVWTTGSWLLYEYLEQAGPDARRHMEHAIAVGDIAWHALPFNWQTEMMDRSMIAGSLGLSKALDRRFGRTTTGAKMTDVPGHTRGLVSPIAKRGVTFLDIGVNGASRPAEVPPMFLWKDSSGAGLAVMYHHGYGGVARVPGSDLAIATVVRGDNSGPHTPAEIVEIYAGLHRQFPNARITANSLTEIANAVEPYRNHLPVVTQEIGDTWIYGVASDPVKVARYREVARLRQTWLAQGKFSLGGSTDLALLQHVLLEPEHTWGTDTKTWLDFLHYTPRDLAAMLHTKKYEVVQFSWKEKRQDLFDGIAALPTPLRDEALTAVRGLEPKEPRMPKVSHPSEKEIETEHFTLALDPRTGAIRRLKSKKTSREWASANHPLALFSYQTLSQADYARFFSNYIISAAPWAKKDFGKPNVEHFGAESRDWLPSLLDLAVEENTQGHRLLARLAIQDSRSFQSGRAAFPQKIYLEFLLPRAEPVLHLNFYWFQKPATRLPEALWLTFNPIANPHGAWTMDKSGEPVSPFDVVSSGSRHMHAVSKGFGYSEPGHTFFVEPLDAPLIALGDKSPLNFSRSQPDLSQGIHCSLFNNAWGTNYIQWFGEDMRFRFALRA